jgi:cephalosporin hydroxylase
MSTIKCLPGGDIFQPECQAFFDLIIKVKPESVFEVGTRRGEGSTYIISSALKENGKGKLYTVECEKSYYDKALQLYSTSLKALNPFVSFNFGKSDEVFPPLLEKVKDIEILFLDGAEDSEQTMREYTLFSPYLTVGSYLVCHDWNIGKMKKLKPILVEDEQWEEVLIINDTPTGFAIHRKVK